MIVECIRMRKIGPDDERIIKVDVKIDGVWYLAINAPPNVVQATVALDFRSAYHNLTEITPYIPDKDRENDEQLASSE